MTRFLLTTEGSAGDVLPFAALGRELARRGHEVVLVTHAPFAPVAREAGIQFVATDDDALYELFMSHSDALLRARSSRQVAAVVRDAHGPVVMARQVDALVDLHQPGDTVLVGRHTSSTAALVAAEVTGAPCAWVAMMPHQVLTAPVAAAFLQGALGEHTETLRHLRGLPARADRESWYHGADLVLGLWPSWFEALGSTTGDVTLTGFLLGDDADLLPDGPPVHDVGDGPVVGDLLDGAVVITGGTGRMLHPEFYPAVLDACSGLDAPVVVVAPRRDMLPATLPPGTTWVPRASFAEALSGAALLVHHGGIGTAVRAMVSGTPQVCFPYGADRPDNAARLRALHLASSVDVRDWGGEKARAVVHEALHGTRTDVARHLVQSQPDAASAGADALERLAGGRSRLAADLLPSEAV